MTEMVWDTIGERYYEMGVDRGVLFIDEEGVPWSGLISVSDSPSGGEATPYYIDGFKYLNSSSPEEFEATIKAFTYPDEFGQCDGSANVSNGLFAMQQPRKEFGLCYRSKVGNDVDGMDHGYKLHVIYRAKVAPTENVSSTLTDSPDPSILSWSVTTTPPRITGRRPTAHFVIDSRTTPEDLMEFIEKILYGSVGSDSRLLPAQELVDMFRYHYLDIDIVDGMTPSSVHSLVYDGGPANNTQTGSINGGAP